MPKPTRAWPVSIFLFAAVATALIVAQPVRAASRQELDRDAAKALKSLYANNKSAPLLGQKARAILVFPNMVKAGFLFGGQVGEGVLTKRGKPVGYYNSVAASYGLQAGVQKFGYALVFLDYDALRVPRASTRLE